MEPACAALLLLVAGALEAPPTRAAEPLFPRAAWEHLAELSPAPGPPGPWSVSAFVGLHDDSRFVDIVQLEGGDYVRSYIGGVAVARALVPPERRLVWELEGSAYQHWRVQEHFELNAAAVARWTDLPWDRFLDTSAAFGMGVSWASERPEFEDETRRFLHHLLAEIEVLPQRGRHLSLVLRVHHRSGVFGLYGVSGGSNFVTLGLRYRL